MKGYWKLLAVAGVMGMPVCASAGVNDDVLNSRTSSAIGVSPDEFSISGRVEDGSRIDYRVETTDGRAFSCYLIAGYRVFGGATVSDAVCSEMGSGGKVSQCNPLLKAAGKC